MNVRRVAADDVVDLRWRILRAGLPRSEAIFPGDDLPTSRHYAALDDNNTVVGCATFHLSEWEGQRAYRLRGMATDPLCRRTGCGRAMLLLAESEILDQTDIRLLWCDARTPAMPFYEKMGWVVRSGVYEIPTAGPHVKMTRSLARATSTAGASAEPRSRRVRRECID
jgi:GNAT superfamily N-acetyltransferase